MNACESTAELDNHADTCVVGEDVCLVTHDFGRKVQVHGYDSSIGATRCKVVSAVVAYDDPSSGQVWMLHIHQAILIPHLRNILLGTMQMRDNGVLVNDQPKSMAEIPTEDHHTIFIPEDEEHHDSLRIPLRLKGVTSFFYCRAPTVQEYETAALSSRLNLTAEEPEWDPSSTHFAEHEDLMLDSRGRLKEPVVSSVAVIHSSEPRLLAAVWSHPTEREPHFDLPGLLEAAVLVEDPLSHGTSAVHSSKRSKAVGPRTLAKNWNIGLAAAERTFKATSQNAIRTILHPTLSRRFRTNDRQLRYRRIPHEMFTDTLEAKVHSWHRRNKYAQIFCTRFGWVRAYPMQKKSQAHEGFSLLAQRDGVPTKLIFDGSKEQNQGKFRKKVKETGTHTHTTLPYSPWSNAAEGEIREVKRGAARKAAKAGSPDKLWDHCLELECYIRSHTAHDIFELNGEVPETLITGQPTDISPFAELGWYEWVKYWDLNESFPHHKEVLGRWLGPSIDVGPAMTSKILKQNGQIIHVGTYRPLNEDELKNPQEIASRSTFDSKITQLLGDPVDSVTLEELGLNTPEYPLYKDHHEGTYQPIPDADDPPPPPEPEPTSEFGDNYVGAEVDLPHQGTIRQGKVKRRARDEEGELFGNAHENPILDTRMYQVEFSDGSSAQYAANIIAENMYAQCDPAGKQHLLLKAIIDHTTDSTAVTEGQEFFIHNGRRQQKKTTKGWKLCVEWSNGSTSWVRLAEMKDSLPIETAEYAVSVGIDNTPAFSWWVPKVLKKRTSIIAAVKARYMKRNFKFGIEIPTTVERAIELDKMNGNTLWQDAIAKELKNAKIAFKTLEEGDKVPVGYNFIGCRLIFTVKIDGFQRKARMVAGGHMLDAPEVPTYASVVSRETVRIALTLAALNDLEVKSSDIQNAYLCAPCEEKVYTVLGPEFGEHQGKKALIVRALYGLKSAGASFSRHLADCMRHIGYTSCKADPDLWMKPATRPEDGFQYYAYILLYVDDVLSIAHDAVGEIKKLDKFFPMKPDSIGDPDIYLGAKLKKVMLDNGVWCWAMSPSKYIQEAISNVESYIKDKSLPKLKTKVRGPWPTDYQSELDISPELDPVRAQYYQSQIGILHWIVELGRIDIITEVSKLASCMALPREGHLEALFHVFAYLKCKHNSRMVFDPCYPNIDIGKFKTDVNWLDFYGDIDEPVPVDAPMARGKTVDMRLFCDADFAGDKKTRRSRSGYILYINNAPIAWLSKKQTTVETSVFGAEFVAMKIGTEAVISMRYKLRMMGVEIIGPCFVQGDNMSVVHNTSNPASTLKKKSNSVCYHFVREAAAMRIIMVGHVPTGLNPADIATKVVPGGIKRDRLVNLILHDIAEDNN